MAVSYKCHGSTMPSFCAMATHGSAMGKPVIDVHPGIAPLTGLLPGSARAGTELAGM